MPFSQEVLNKVLVDCGRCCCICHNFCGKHMEVHHIIQEADGGTNTYDNAIPLCFNCHADMGKTDPHHPKGRGYTADELKMHRDRWYDQKKREATGQRPEIVTVTDIEKKEYLKRYKAIRFEASCAIDYYANVFTDIVKDKDDRHENASDALRKIGVIIKAFATEERPEGISIPDTKELKEAGGLFIGLSNCMYFHNGEDSFRLLECNLKSEERIKEILKL